eukprot:6044904-Amphidinium_carterae.2
MEMKPMMSANRHVVCRWFDLKNYWAFHTSPGFLDLEGVTKRCNHFGNLCICCTSAVLSSFVCVVAPRVGGFLAASPLRIELRQESALQ